MQSTRKQPGSLTPNDPAVRGREIRYAVYFDEGVHYYLANHLSSTGSTSVTMLVCTVEGNDNEERHTVSVRKLNDLWPYRSELGKYQTEEIRNLMENQDLMKHPCTPSLEAWQEYTQVCPGEVLDEYGSPQRRNFKYVTTASTWKFCNAGPMGTFIDAWYDHYNTDRFPEAFIWEYIFRIGRVLIDAQTTGVAHQDMHHWNVVLDWPDSESFPVPYLIDWGQSKQFPIVEDARFRRPFNDSIYQNPNARLFDSRGRVISDELSRSDRDSLNTWYGAAFDDLESCVVLAQDIILRNRPTHYQTPADGDQFAGAYFNTAVQRGEGVKGYSFQLTRTFADLINLVRASTNAYQLHYAFKAFIANRIAPHRAASKAAFGADADEVARLEDWIGERRQPEVMPPLTWTDFYSMYKYADNENVRYSATALGQGRSTGEDVFAAYREGNWDMNNPLVEIDHPELDEPIFLRLNQFLIGEGVWDEETQEFEFHGFVDPTHHVPDRTADNSSNWGDLVEELDDMSDVQQGIHQPDVSQPSVMDIDNDDSDAADHNIRSSPPQYMASLDQMDIVSEMSLVSDYGNAATNNDAAHDTAAHSHHGQITQPGANPNFPSVQAHAQIRHSLPRPRRLQSHRQRSPRRPSFSPFSPMRRSNSPLPINQDQGRRTPVRPSYSPISNSSSDLSTPPATLPTEEEVFGYVFSQENNESRQTR